MRNNIIAAEMQSLAMCRKDGGELFQVVINRKDGTIWTSNTFPQRYAEEFAATERDNDRGHRFRSVAVERVR